MTILILGGTAEARALAQALVDQGRPVLSSLAGRVSSPALPAGEVRIGGFGGVDGLRRFLEERQITAVVDATHPFAAQISANAAQAAAMAGSPLLRLARPGWSSHPNAADWTWVPDNTAAVHATAGQRPFLTTGRQSLRDFLPWADRAALVRVVDPPDLTLPPAWRLIQSRGPYGYASERQLMLEHRVDVLVTKDSGGPLTSAKLDAATDLGVELVIVSRPPDGSGVSTALSVDEALTWVTTNPKPAHRRDQTKDPHFSG